MRFLIVLLFLACPAHAITYNVTAEITDCIAPTDFEEECDGKIGRRFDGDAILNERLVNGPLISRWLMACAGCVDELLTASSNPDTDPTTFIPLRALRVQLGFPAGDRYAGLHYDDAGQLDHWWFGVLRDDQRFEVASFGTQWAGANFFASGPPGQLTEVAPIPLPMPILMLLGGVAAIVGLRFRRGRNAAPA